MAKKKDYYLVHLDWKKDLFEDFDGNEDFILAGQRMVYFFLSMESGCLRAFFIGSGPDRRAKICSSLPGTAIAYTAARTAPFP